MNEWQTAMKERRVGTKIDEVGFPPIYRLSDSSICKRVGSDFQNFGSVQVWIMQLVATQTTIPVPPIRRLVISKNHKTSYLDMEYIDGVDLDDVWPSASWWNRLKIVWTLRGYIQQLRKVRAPFPDIPGPITWNGRPNPCFSDSEFGHYGAGPFPTYADLTTFFETMRALTLHSRYAAYHPRIRIRDHFDDSSPLVLTHLDLHLRNIRLGTDGKLYLLDWGRAGLYPTWFESWALSNRRHFCVPRSFQWFYWIICGWYPIQRQFMYKIGYGLDYFSHAWRIDLDSTTYSIEVRTLSTPVDYLLVPYSSRTKSS